MTQILEFFGFPTTGKGATWGYVAIGCMAVIVLDILNIADVVGMVKRQTNKFAPSFFKEDKFRKAVATTKP